MFSQLNFSKYDSAYSLCDEFLGSFRDSIVKGLSLGPNLTNCYNNSYITYCQAVTIRYIVILWVHLCGYTYGASVGSGPQIYGL